MSDQGPQAAGESGSLQLDHAEFAEGQPQRCAVCSQALAGSYYEVAGRVCCAACHQRLVGAFERRPGPAGFLRAAGAGLAAAVAGAGIYFGVSALTGYHFGLISILVGFLVGKAVHWGCGGHGGWSYQALAVALTYLAIVGTYVPAVYAAYQRVDAPSALLIAAAVPLRGGVGILGLIVIAVGLYEAWQLNRRPRLQASGPHALTPAAWRR